MKENDDYQLTVITVCFNVLQELPITVDSVLSQKKKGTLRIEHLIVDGASRDGSAEWLQEQKDAGRIENFISEPDSGIYDAMNKGIAMAHGRVLAFLNAGDYYAEIEDLACCVMPIVDGKCKTVCGTAVIHHPSGKCHDYTPGISRAWLNMGFSHQAYFASAEAYAEVGGYDHQHFRSAGDFDMVNAMQTKYGDPVIVPVRIVHFMQGGFSTGSWTMRRHEMVEIHHRSWDKICQRCEKDAAYQLAALVMLSSHIVTLVQWSDSKLKEHIGTVAQLREMLASFPKTGLSPALCCYLAWIQDNVLLSLERQCRVSCLKRVRLYWQHIRCAPTWQSRLSPVLKPWQKSLLKRFLGD